MKMVISILWLLYLTFLTRIECLVQGKSYLIKVSDKESNGNQKSDNIDRFYSIEDDNEVKDSLNGR